LRGFEYLEHTADVYIRAYGNSLKEAFAEAARATTNVMTNVDQIVPKIEREFYVKAEDLEGLLYRWIEEIIIIFDVEQIVFSDFEVKIEKYNNEWNLKAKAKGEEFDPSRHEIGTEIKAMTYGMIKIEVTDKRTIVEFILDI